MYTLRIIVNRGWYPALITVLAVLGVLYNWPIEWVAPALIFILALGLVVTVIRARERQLERAVFRMRQLANTFIAVLWVTQRCPSLLLLIAFSI